MQTSSSSSVFRRIVPGAVHCREAHSVPSRVASRSDQYNRGRILAKDLCGALGADSIELTKGLAGMPRWPSGVVGSITHCGAYSAAAAADSSEFAALGIDAEINGAVAQIAPDLLLSQRELGRVAMAAPEPLADPQTVMFCLKEAAYKAWSSCSGGWLDFLDMETTYDVESLGGAASVEIVPSRERSVGDSPLVRLNGRWMLTRHGLLVVALILKRDQIPVGARS